MNCQEFWNQLSKPPGGEFEPGSEWSVHLQGCPVCAAHLARQRELTAGLRRMAEIFSGVKAPPRVEARLLRTFRAQYGSPARVERRRWLAPLVWAAAVAMVLAAGLFLTGARTPAPPAATPATIVLASAQEPSAASIADESLPDIDSFIPLPNAERIGPNEDFNLVRVEVPRSAMMAVGIPVSADRASEPVEADVLLGSDGQARAVRFME